ncbi:tail fiber protein [Membranicola marinus]|uniref:Tail fiber protein n=1 Tax=Membranihabitans marinus TaxID=1227546 RepID=A0A953HLQ5_9BACT|nr:tail fiber protein [Membranihabitans marinus]MBY5956813.1 tail fiber protein [Membranihabitans marinus]
MAEPFLAEIRIVGFNFPPRGWAFCDGQILPINQNQSLYSLLGANYGGDGRTSFALPDLRGRVPIHTGRSNGGGDRQLGQKSGEETHTLTENEMPQHTHQLRAVNAENNTPLPNGDHLSQSTPAEFYNAPANLVNLASNTVTFAGGGQAHENMQPYLVVNFCIALQGLFPSRN